MTTIRASTGDDCEQVALVHLTAWRESYQGVVPQSVLDGLSLSGHAERWWRKLAEPQQLNYVAIQDQDIVGFASGGPCRGTELGQDMEFYAIYLLERVKRQGIGRRLLRRLADDFLSRGATSAGVWVLKDNSAGRSFYERMGGTIATEMVDHRPGWDAVEIGYVWRDLRSWTIPQTPTAAEEWWAR